MASDAVDLAVHWTDYLAVGIAGLALIVSIVAGTLNARNANKALKMAQKQEERRDLELEVYLDQSISRVISDEVSALCFSVQVSNPRSEPNTVERCELHVSYAVEGRVIVLKLPTLDAEGIPALGLHSSLRFPLRLPAGSSESGWIAFKLDPELTGGRPIDRYDLQFEDVYKVVTSRQVTLVLEEQQHHG